MAITASGGGGGPEAAASRRAASKAPATTASARSLSRSPIWVTSAPPTRSWAASHSTWASTKRCRPATASSQRGRTSMRRVASAMRASRPGKAARAASSAQAGQGRGQAVEEPPEQAAGAEQGAEALRRHRVVPQGGDEGGVVRGGGHQEAELFQPQVGVGGDREPSQHQRKQLLHQPAAPGQAGGELLEGAPRPGRILEAQGGQLSSGSLGGEPGCRGGGEGLEQAAGRRGVRGWPAPRPAGRPGRSRSAPGRWGRGRRGSPWPWPGAPAPPERPGPGGCGAIRPVAGDAPRCAASSRHPPGRRRRRGSRSRRRRGPAVPPGCARRRRVGSARPWTSCSNWTANSMSRKPPTPRLISSPRRAAIPSARAFMDRTSRTASGARVSG